MAVIVQGETYQEERGYMVAHGKDNVEMSRAYYNKLKTMSDFLQCLMDCGVNDWECYGNAVDSMDKLYNNEEWSV